MLINTNPLPMGLAWPSDKSGKDELCIFLDHNLSQTVARPLIDDVFGVIEWAESEMADVFFNISTGQNLC